MIGQLRGNLVHKQPPGLVVDVHGVGYELEAPMTTFYDLPEVGQGVTLFTHLVVREDAQLLYGFSRVGQRDLFRSLLKVNGVGPRVALAILSGMTADEFSACVAEQDAARLTRVPGIGRKTAERLVMEMRDKLQTAGGETFTVPAADAPRDPVGEAVSALIALGYKPPEASRAVRGVTDAGSLSSEEIIRLALRNIAGLAS
jgi:Holliday junction DNA helicase RuvA